MYHRFEENKYPSTNIKLNDFLEHIKIIKNSGLIFVHPSDFQKKLEIDKDEKKILLTIDDAFLSFYEKAWPILKKEKIPFILFVSTREVGKYNYMTWDQIREVANESFAHIGNHSHSHEYLIDKNEIEITDDIKFSISKIQKEIGYKSEFFSYPFGEYSILFKEIIKKLGFKYAFGQHSGVIDSTKDYYELPRFPINEKYGNIKRFKTLINTLPLKYKEILPVEKYINKNNNPPKVTIQFFENIKNLNSIKCYSNEKNTWRESKIKFLNNFKIEILLQGEFTTERGRINCSIREDGFGWRWLGIQFVVAEK